MKRNRILLALTLVFALFLSACASRGNSTASALPTPEPAQYAGEYASDGKGYAVAEGGGLNLAGTAGTVNGSRVYSDADSKLIRQASVTIQSIDFPAAIAALDELTTRLGGYYENAKTQGGGYYDSNARRYAYYTVRIPKANCDAFIAATGDIGHVVSSSESSADVGDQYYDTELRLKTLQTKQERLLSLLEKAELMEDIIAIENALSDVQYQVEQFTSNLKHYDGLVDFATISIEINEVTKLSDDPGEAASLGERLSAACIKGFSDFGTALGNITVWVAYHLIGIIVFVAIVAVAVTVTPRVLRRWRRRDDPPTQ